MAEQEQRAAPMEGRSRGANIHSGGTQDTGGLEPPYEGRSTTDEIDKRISTDHAADPRETSQEEREGVSANDTTAASPLGVGESTGAQGNEETLGESEEERTKGRLETTYTGVGRSEPIDPNSPNLQPGDQGG